MTLVSVHVPESADYRSLVLSGYWGNTPQHNHPNMMCLRGKIQPGAGSKGATTSEWVELIFHAHVVGLLMVFKPRNSHYWGFG